MSNHPDSVLRFDQGKKLGLALGGGAVLGAAHIGVLRALEEDSITIDFLAGTSIGAFVSAFYAFGLNSREIESTVEGLDWMDVSGLSLSQFGLLSNKKIGNTIRGVIGDVDFAEAGIPLAMIAADIGTGEMIVLREGNVADAVMASTCIPGIFAPLEIGGRMLVDGGIVENVPVSPLQEMGAEGIIAVDLNSKPGLTRPTNIIGVLLNSLEIIKLNASRLRTREADILIAPDLTDFNGFDTDQVKKLIAVGYNEAKRVLGEVQ